MWLRFRRLSDVTYIDSTIIAELARLHNARAASNLERETVVMQNPNLTKLFDLLRLASVFHVVETLDHAVGKNGEQIVVRYASSFDGAAAPRHKGSIREEAV